jgi:hypothetical protein
VLSKSRVQEGQCGLGQSSDGMTPLLMLLTAWLVILNLLLAASSVGQGPILHARHVTKPSLVGSKAMSRALYLGDDYRLRHALHKAYSGLPMKISIIGGSISFGLGAGRYRYSSCLFPLIISLGAGHLGDQHPTYFKRLQVWAKDAWPGSNVSVVNGAFPAVSSTYMSSCVSLHVPSDSDIVLVELAANDSPSYDGWVGGSGSEVKTAFERLIRKILNRPNRPAVILLNAFQHPNNMADQWRKDHLYFQNAESFYFDMATYYGLSLASLKSAVFPSILRSEPGFWLNGSQYSYMFVDGVITLAPENAKYKEGLNYLFWDNMHLSGHTGHRVLADLVIEIILKASRRLLFNRSSTKEDEAISDIHLPPPVFKGNYEAGRESCVVGQHLLEAATSKKGFEWVNDQSNPKKPAKWGWTAYEAGSEVNIKLSTVPGPATGEQDLDVTSSLVSVSIGYLSSYEQMGKFRVSCLNCSCSNYTFSGHDQSRHVSQMTIGQMRVSAHPACTLHIQALSDTASGKHKVKILALVISESMVSSLGAVTGLSDTLSEQLEGSLALVG